MTEYIYFVAYFYVDSFKWGNGNLQSTIDRLLTMNDIRKIEKDLIKKEGFDKVTVTNFILLETRIK